MTDRDRRVIRASLRLGVAVLLLYGLTALGAASRAEDVTVPARLSLVEAVDLALGGNPRIKQANKDYLNALSESRVAGFTTSFSIGSTATVAHNPYDSSHSGSLFGAVTYENLLGTEASLSISPFASGNSQGKLSLSVSHPLMRKTGRLSTKSNSLLSAKSGAMQKDKALFLQRQATVQDVVDTYYRAVQARQQAKVQEDALAIAEKTAEMSRKREAAGYETGLDVVRAESAVAERRDALNLQQQSARGAMDRLMVAIGSGVGNAPELIDTVPEVPDLSFGLAEAIDKALSNRPEFAVYDEQIADQKRRLAIAKEDLKPGLAFETSFNSSDDQSSILSASLIRNGYFNAGLVYRYPLDRRIAEVNRDNESRNLDILTNLRTFQIEQVVEQVRSAYRDMESAKTSLEINNRNLSVAEERLHLAERMVEEGQGTNREVLDAQNGLIQVKSGIISAKMNLYLAMVNLKYYMGEDLTTLVTK